MNVRCSDCGGRNHLLAARCTYCSEPTRRLKKLAAMAGISLVVLQGVWFAFGALKL